MNTMGRVMNEGSGNWEPYHVVQCNEGIVHGNNGDIRISCCNSGNQTTNSAKSEGWDGVKAGK